MAQARACSLADLTTLRVGGPAQALEARSKDDLVEAVTGAGGDPCLVVGGGSNLLVSDSGVDVPVVLVRTSGVRVAKRGSEVVLDVEAGESWDELVERCVAEGWSGVECLSGIPGSVGATPVQNVGAYGQELADVVDQVEVHDRLDERTHALSASDCGFGYRTSIFKEEPTRFVVLAVRLRLRVDGQSGPLRYSELADRLEVPLGCAAPLGAVRETVLQLRRRKGMVLDPDDHDTWSAGSFFTNPVVGPDQLPQDAPRWQQPDGRVKGSAAWLIEQAGFAKGFGAELGTGRATLSTKHTLAITNRGGASAADIVLLARTVRDGVRREFGVTLHPEPTLVGVCL